LLALALAACTPKQAGPDAGTCPMDLPPPSRCNSAVPTYTADVAPIFAVSCVDCHSSDGGPNFSPLGTYPQVVAQRQAVLTQVLTCLMPIAPVPPLTEAQRQTILSWLVCGVPQ
jgi:mono/diheme cytochrome c family protein